MEASISSSRPLNLAIVGCGQIVTHHVEAISKSLGSTKLRIRALCDPSEDRRTIIESFAGDLVDVDGGVVHCASLAELMERDVWDSIDMVFIAVPHDLHESLAMLALSSNSTPKMVILEKPLAPTAASCAKLVQTSEALSTADTNTNTNTNTNTGTMLFIAEQSPYWEEVLKARELMAQNDIGRIVTAASYYYESMRDNITSGDTEGGGLGWRGSLARAGGGVAMDGGLHWIRPLREMLGNIERVMGVVRGGSLAPELCMEGEAVGHALFQIASAASGDGSSDASCLTQPLEAGPLIATYSANLMSHAPMAHDACPYFRITGTRGEIIIHGTGLDKTTPGAGGVRLYNNRHPKGTECYAADRTGGFFNGFQGLWTEMHRVWNEKDYGKAHESVVRASDDVAVVLALYKSSKSGHWESV